MKKYRRFFFMMGMYFLIFPHETQGEEVRHILSQVDEPEKIALNASSIIPDENGIVYVKENGLGNGTSWIEATNDLQSAIDAEGVNQVWVAWGEYRPSAYLEGDSTDDKLKSFIMKDGVSVYGSFEGWETSIWQREITFLTPSSVKESHDYSILAADTVVPSYHVVIFDTAGFTTQTYLDGFFITGGVADTLSTIPPHNFGGGVVVSSNGILKNCYVSGNKAEIGGGVVLLDGGVIDSSKVAENSTTHEGGGVAIIGNGLVKNSIIEDNSSSDRGGGGYVEGNGGEFINCRVMRNHSKYGGGLYYRNSPN
ncbi:MAG TPA: hypothetical protein PKU86_07270 [Bacteroidales bacterium]|nr:hypothetical protein [Bacteroidales bacterium]